MGVQRVFLGWGSPCLPAAAEFLIGAAPFDDSDWIDLSNAIVVVPGARAGRRLIELLTEKAEGLGRPLSHPDCVTIGLIPEKLLNHGSGDIATPSERALFWTTAIQRCNAFDILYSRRPESLEIAEWLGFASDLDRLAREVRGEDLTFTHIAERCSSFAGYCDDRRWEALASVEEEYHSLLSEAGLIDPFVAHREALDGRFGPCEKHIFLLGVTDLPALYARILLQCCTSVTSLIHAPQELATGFDQLGCVIEKYWREYRLSGAIERTRTVAGVEAQANEVRLLLHALEEKYSADEITIGVLSEATVPVISQELDLQLLPHRVPQGTPIARTSPMLLLDALARYRSTRSYVDFATLLRHPALRRYLESKIASSDRATLPLLVEFDTYYSRQFPDQFGELLADSPSVGAVVREINRFLEHFSGKRQSSDWHEHVAKFLETIFGGEPLKSYVYEERVILESICALHSTGEELAYLRSDEKFSFLEWMALLKELIRDARVLPEPTEEAIEILGWLELPLDDAPVMIITDFVEGLIPEAVLTDPFLPNSFRAHLGMFNEEMRFARDAYRLAALVASVKELFILVPQKDREGAATLPSRLLSLESGKPIEQFMVRFTDKPAETAPYQPALLAGESSEFNFPVKPSPPSKKLTQLPITGIPAYIECPYRFYLTYVLQLFELSDHDQELSPANYGSLLHETLEAFAGDEIRNSDHAGEIEEFLVAWFDKKVVASFANHYLPVLSLQFEECRARLKSFAKWQAEWRQRGWEIHSSEFSLESSIFFPGLALRGRIDRIDYHPALSRFTLIDYKTGEGKVLSPQLPLYLLILIREKKIPHLQEDMCDLLYLGLSGYEKVFEDFISVDPAMLERIELEARDALQSIQAGIFWPPRRKDSAFGSALERIIPKIGVECS